MFKYVLLSAELVSVNAKPTAYSNLLTRKTLDKKDQYLLNLNSTQNKSMRHKERC